MDDFNERAHRVIKEITAIVEQDDPSLLTASTLLTAVGMINEALHEIERLDEGIRDVLDIPYGLRGPWRGQPDVEVMIGELLALTGSDRDQVKHLVSEWKSCQETKNQA